MRGYYHVYKRIAELRLMWFLDAYFFSCQILAEQNIKIVSLMYD